MHPWVPTVVHKNITVRRVWAGAGLQRAAYRGGGISCGFSHSLLVMVVLAALVLTDGILRP